MCKSLTIAALLMLVLAMPVAAQDAAADLPDITGEDQTLEPEVTIRQQGSRTIHEYRMNGRLYMVKIVPQAGPPYYLVDLDGDGEMDTSENDPARIVVPQWVLFRW